MPRSRRLYEPGKSLHVMKRGHNRSRVFDDDLDCEVFLYIVRKAGALHGLDVHGFALMMNHFHLQVTPQHELATEKGMKKIAEDYQRYYARKHGTIGSIWNERYKHVHIVSAWQWLVCLRYIDRNAAEAAVVDKPERYRWTSYNAHTGGTTEHRWLVDHEHFVGLGPTAAERHAIYRTLCAVPLNEAERILVKYPIQHELTKVV